MESVPTTNHAKGAPTSIKEQVLHAGASMVQNFDPPKQLCAHLHAYHTYADNPGKPVEANHYCAHVNEDVRQCIVYDSDGPNARLIGIEYLIKPHLYEKLDAEERKLWHSHVYEVKSRQRRIPGFCNISLTQACQVACWCSLRRLQCQTRLGRWPRRRR